MVALVDCNNFFASCERVFRPDLENVPVMVLSANDGCVIARSNEVKAIGIKMGTPLFKIRDIVINNKVHTFSTNYALYGEISNRIMKILKNYTPKLEVYSIDEAFLDFSHIKETEYEKYAKIIVKAVKKETAIPISIGIACTKTLAKVASKVAKKLPENFNTKYLKYSESDEVLKNFSLSDIWGVGFSLTEALPKIGIQTPYDLKYADISFIRKRFGVTLQKTVLELNGTKCINIDNGFKDKKSIIRSRSFGQLITEYRDIENAISTHIAHAAKDLRKNHELAWYISVFIRTDRFNTKIDQYRNFHSEALSYATNDTIIMNKLALIALKKIYVKGYAYKKAGVMISEIVPETNVQYSFGQKINQPEKTQPLMKALDKLTRKYGDHSLHLASEGEKPRWLSQSRLRSPDYLGNWEQIPIVK